MDKRCWNCANEKELTECFDCVFDCKKPSKWSAGKIFVPNTNGDKIREMNNAEQAKFFSQTFCHGYGEPQLLEWLDKPVEDTL